MNENLSADYEKSNRKVTSYLNKVIVIVIYYFPRKVISNCNILLFTKSNE
jgi:hypothetical protein